MPQSTAIRKDAIYFHDLHDHVDTMAVEVHTGLSQSPKSLSPKFFYDKRGSELFDAITELPEYYPTRTEVELLQQHGKEMAELLGRHGFLLELGSGSSAKIRLLLEALQPNVYVPIDISRQHLIDSAQLLVRDHPWLTVHAMCIDYSQPAALPDLGPGCYNAFFPGSSIGNFEPADALTLLRRIHQWVGHEGGLLIGVDLKKDHQVLNAAYNDAQGLTADFNLNVLQHINSRLDSNFDLTYFRHQASYEPDKGCIEMHLESTEAHQVHINGNTYNFAVGETIHTENSYKYSIDEFHALADRADFTPVKVWSDPQQLFSIHYLTAK